MRPNVAASCRRNPGALSVPVKLLRMTRDAEDARGLRTLAHHVVKALEDGIKPDKSLLGGVGVPEVGWLLRLDDATAAATAQRLTRQPIIAIDTALDEGFR